MAPTPLWNVASGALTFLARLLKVSLLLLVFCGSLVGGAVLHLGLPVARHAAADILERYLSSTFLGGFEIGALERLSSGGVRAKDLLVTDPQGRQVLAVDRLEADVDPMDILTRILSDHEKLSITISRAYASGCELSFLPGTLEDGVASSGEHISLVDAFTPRKKSSGGSSGDGRPVRVWFPKIVLRDVYAHGAMFGSPVLEARVPLARANLLATNKGVAIDVNRFGLTASGFSGVDTTARGEVHVRVPGAVWGDVTGSLGNIPLRHQFRFEHENLDVTGHYPELRASEIRPLLGSWPLDRDIAADVHVFGWPPKLDVEATIRPRERSALNSKPIVATGHLLLAPENQAEVTVTTHELDISRLLSTLPTSSLDSESRLTFDWSSGFAVQGETRLERGTLSSMQLPDTTAEGAWSAAGWALSARVSDGAISGEANASQTSGEPISFEAQLYPSSIGQSPLLRHLLPPIQGNVLAKVSGELQEERFSANLDLRAAHLSYQALRVENAQLNSSLTGNINSTRTVAGQSRLSASELSVGSVVLSKVDVVHSGPLLAPLLQLHAETSSGVDISAQAKVDLQRSRVVDLQGTLSGAGQPIQVAAERVSYGNSEVEVRGFSLESIGEIQGNFRVAPGEVSADVRARRLSVSRISHALGLSRGEFEGELDADIDLMVGQQSRGHVSMGVRDGAILGVSGIELDARVNVLGQNISGKIHTSVSELAALDSSWDLRLAGSPLAKESYTKAHGQFALDTQNIDLRTLSLLFLGNEALPQLAGRGSASLQLSRDQGEPPHGTLSLSTEGLEVSLKKSDFSSRGVDVNAVATVTPDGKSVEAALRLMDPYGQLVSLSGALELPFDDWSLMFPDEKEVFERLKHANVSLVALLPDRKINHYPLFVPRIIEEGTLSARIGVQGSLSAPDLSVVFTAVDWFGGESPFVQPIDVHLNARYQSTSRNLVGSLVAERGESRLGSTQFDVTMAEQVVDAVAITERGFVYRPPPSDIPYWLGNAQIFLESSPLSLLKAIERWGLGGSAQGSIQVERTKMLPDFSSELLLRNAQFEHHDLGDASLRLENLGREFVARVFFQDDSGTLEVAAETGVVEHPWLLGLNPERPIRFSARAERYDSAVFMPFVSGVFDELSGPLIGRASAEVQATGDEDEPLSVRLNGELRVENGIMTPTALGTRLRGLSARIKATSKAPYNFIQLTELSARTSASGQNLRGEAEVRLKNLTLEEGRFVLHADEMPLSAGGSTLADLTGKATGSFVMRDDELKSKIVIDDLTAELPQSAKTNLIELSDNPTIEIVQAPLQEQTENSQTSTLPIEVEVLLGQNVRVRSGLFDVRVRGNPSMRIAETFSMGGAVELVRGGRFVVLGRSFIVERGLLMFDTEDASSPHIQTVASWKAPNGVLVRVTVGGTLSEPTLSWSSEPALPGGEADVISLVLGGGGGSDERSVGSTSIAIAANELADVEGLEFYTTRHATSGEGRIASLTDSSFDSYTAAYQISDELWFEGSFKSGSYGLNSTHTGVSGTLEWRFHPHWSARTEVGTLGAGLDMLWQYRY